MDSDVEHLLNLTRKISIFCRKDLPKSWFTKRMLHYYRSKDMIFDQMYSGIIPGDMQSTRQAQKATLKRVIYFPYNSKSDIIYQSNDIMELRFREHSRYNDWALMRRVQVIPFNSH